MNAFVLLICIESFLKASMVALEFINVVNFKKKLNYSSR
jgi:hypothetical protein